MRNFKNYRVWHQAMQLVKDVYQFSSQLPGDERFGLISQMRRSAISIPSNIAEGSGRESDREFRRFIEISLSSCFELETQLILAAQLFEDISARLCTSVLKALTDLQRALSSLFKSLLID